MSDAFPDVVLSGPRLTLRPLVAMDLDAVVVAASDEETQRWLPLPRPYTLEHARSFCLDLAPTIRTSGNGLVRAVEHEGSLAAMIDLKRTDWRARVVEIGYWTSPSARGRGLMTEATALLARWVLETQDFARVELRIEPGNAASRRVAVKAGFTEEGTARSVGYIHGGRVDLVIYSLIRTDLGPAEPQQ